MVTLDVVIPSFRLNAATLLPILQLKKPEDAVIKFYLIADNPVIVPHKSIKDLVDHVNVFLIINEFNAGASFTRNKGIESGLGDWILFLDDDVEVLPDLLFTYTDAIKRYPDETGFIGVVNLPVVETSFAKAVNANGSMSMFSIAKHKGSYAWGVTANFMISRIAVGEVRFSEVYPKTGGGEDVEFFLRIRELNDFNNYKCIKNAEVTHPWWNNGDPDLKRFYRYGKGISFLPERNPLYRSYDFLNTMETLMVLTVVFIFVLVVDRHNRYLAVLPYFMLLTILLEYLISLRITIKNKQGFSPLVAMYVMLLRSCNDAGVLVNNILRSRIAGLGERFHFNGQIKKAYFTLNTNKIIKLIIYLLAIGYAVFKS